MLQYNYSKGLPYELRVGGRRKMEDKEMTNQQFDSLIEMIAKIVEKSESVEEAVKEIRNLKTTKPTE